MTRLHSTQPPAHHDDGLLDQLPPSGRWIDDIAQQVHDDIVEAAHEVLVTGVGIGLESCIFGVTKLLAKGSTRFLDGVEWLEAARIMSNAYQMARVAHPALAECLNARVELADQQAGRA